MTEPQFQFRGVWLPADVLRLLESGELNCRAVMLLAIIDALVVSPAKGCYASNTYLAKRIGSSSETVRRMLADLEDWHLITRVTQGNGYTKREIFTAWSRPLDEQTPHKTVGVPPQNCGGYNKEITNNKSGLAADGDIDMGFFKDETQPHKATPSRDDVVNAQTLLTIVQQKLPGRTCNLKNWANTMRLLRYDATKDRVRAAIIWYADHHSMPFVPQAYAAKSFREKFTAIEAAMERDLGPRVIVGDMARDIAERLTPLNWPKGSAKDLPVAVQVSLDNYQQFKTGLDSLVAHLREDLANGRFFRLAEHMQRQAPATREFVIGWFDAICKRVQGWDAWGGDLHSMAFAVDHKDFTKQGRQWAIDYAGRADRWDELMKRIDSHEAAKEK